MPIARISPSVIFFWRVTNCLSVIDPTPVGLQNRTQCRGSECTVRTQCYAWR